EATIPSPSRVFAVPLTGAPRGCDSPSRVRLILIRHADAGNPDPRRYPDDRSRPLTPDGERQHRLIADGLARMGLTATHVLTSPPRPPRPAPGASSPCSRRGSFSGCWASRSAEARRDTEGAAGSRRGRVSTSERERRSPVGSPDETMRPPLTRARRVAQSLRYRTDRTDLDGVDSAP